MSVISGGNRQAWSVVSLVAPCDWAQTDRKTFFKTINHRAEICFSLVLLPPLIFAFIHSSCWVVMALTPQRKPWTAFLKQRPFQVHFIAPENQWALWMALWSIKASKQTANMIKRQRDHWAPGPCCSASEMLRNKDRYRDTAWVFIERLQTNKKASRKFLCSVSLHCSCQAQTLHVALLFMIYSSVYLPQAQHVKKNIRLFLRRVCYSFIMLHGLLGQFYFWNHNLSPLWSYKPRSSF